MHSPLFEGVRGQQHDRQHRERAGLVRPPSEDLFAKTAQYSQIPGIPAPGLFSGIPGYYPGSNQVRTPVEQTRGQVADFSRFGAHLPPGAL